MTTDNRQLSEVQLAAQLYRRKGWWPIPIAILGDGAEQDGKAPRKHKEWQKLRISEDEVPKFFGTSDNVGLLLGEPSGHLTDVDLDMPEAVRIAHQIFPPTAMRHGRQAAGLSHLWYTCADLRKTHKLQDTLPDGKPGGVILELRYGSEKGMHTVVPPSRHMKSGDRLFWVDKRGSAIVNPTVEQLEQQLLPTRLKAAQLVQAAEFTAACVQLALSTPAPGEGQTHEFSLALAGYLARYMPDRERAQQVVRLVLHAANRSDRTDEFLRALEDSYRRKGGEEPTRGAKSLSEYTGAKRLDQVAARLGIRTANAGHSPRGDRGGQKTRSGVNRLRYELGTEMGHNDNGNAQRIIEAHGREMLYCPSLEGWHLWDGMRWERDRKGRALNRSAAVMRGIEAEVKTHEGDEDRQALTLYWASESQKLSRMQAALAIAATVPAIAATAEEVDSDPLKLNLANGTLHTEPGEVRLHRHDPKDRITKLAPVEHDPQAQCPQWMAFLERIFRRSVDGRSTPDPDLIGFVQRLAGYALRGGNPEQVVVFLHGSGANGKSTFLGTLREILGEYAQTTSADALMARDGSNNNQHYALAKLKGCYLALIEEFNEGQRLNEALVKAMTGGEQISARYPHQGFFEFEPWFLLMAATNHLPSLTSVDEGIRRRVLCVPFLEYIPPDERDPNLREKLRTEYPGILNWMLAGLEEYDERVMEKGRGLHPPAPVAAATGAYFDEQDDIGQFIEDCCTIDAHAMVPKGDVYKAFTRWCEENGRKPWAHKTFSQKMENTQVLDDQGRQVVVCTRRTGSTRMWRGLRVEGTTWAPDLYGEEK